jgi:dTDP-4-amino-4,6-dideoxygalactose transaminase
MEIPFHKPYISEDEISEVVDTLRSGWITMGPKTLRFEEEFAKYIPSHHAVAVNSGTAALHLAMKAIHLNPGDEVIIPTTTFTATGEVVCYINAIPVIVDVDQETHNIDVTAIEKAITRKTKAIIPVHFAGQPCDMDEIMQLAKAYHLSVVEDAAHAIPAWYRRRRIGTIGDMTCFSFYSTKPLATGEGGMVTTENDDWAERVRILRLHGISKDAWKRYSKGGSWYYEVIEPGFKYNMTDLQASLGIAQLRKVDWLWEKRKEIARRYTEAFTSTGGIITPSVKPDRESAWHLYAIKLKLEALTIDRNGFIEKLRERGIETSVHFIPLHRHPYYKNAFGLMPGDFPNAEWIYERSISLPIYPGMTDEEVSYVIEQVSDLCKGWKK